MKIRYFIIVLSILFASCGAKKRAASSTKKPQKVEQTVSKEKETSRPTKPKTGSVTSTTEQYIATFAETAKNNMRNYKIPASITLAQGILESGSGKGRLAIKANNHFGIKCHDWKGAKIYHDDDRAQECFRKYKKAASSYEDHSEFLTTRKRYASLFKLKQDDYKAWARGLKNAGYATDIKYPQKLISLIQRYELYKYDSEVLGKDMTDDIKVNQGVLRYVIIKGDTLYSLSKRYNMTVEAIKELNNMTSNHLSVGQEIMLPK